MKRFYKLTAYGCGFYGALDSSLVVFSAAYSSTMQFASKELAIAIGVLSVLLVGFVIDFGLMQGLQTFFGRIYDKNSNTFKSQIMLFSFVFLSIQTASTLTLTLYGRHFVSDLAVPKPIILQPDYTKHNQIQDLSEQYSNQLQYLDAEEKKELRRAVTNQVLLDQAKEGNRWAKTKVNEIKKEISDKYTKKKIELISLITKTNDERLTALNQATEFSTQMNKDSIAKYNQKINFFNDMQLYLACSSTILLILSSLLYTLEKIYLKESDDEDDDKPSNRSPFGLFTRVQKKT